MILMLGRLYGLRAGGLGLELELGFGFGFGTHPNSFKRGRRIGSFFLIKGAIERVILFHGKKISPLPLVRRNDK
jgi:hypothetical protein